MRKNLVNTVFFVLILMWVPTGLMGQSMVTSVGVDKEDIDLRGSVQILDSLTVTVAESGKALLRFDGYCVASPGDKIYLAVSKTRIWGACDDNINIEVPDSDVNMAPFVHTRVFNISPGTHTFYAVAHNHIELDGTGIASIHGNLLLEFFAGSDPELVGFKEIAAENKFVREVPYQFASTTLLIPESGKVHVTFDGLCLSSPGDLVALAASEETDWALFNGGVLVEAYNGDILGNSFSHSRVYDVGPGTYTFYAIGENLQEIDGNGRVSVFGSLTAVYYPGKINTTLASNAVLLNSIDIRNDDYLVSQINMNAEGGDVLLQYNGMASIDSGDQVTLAIVESPFIPTGHVNMLLESFSEDMPNRSFSITKLYEVEPGEHTFYVLARNRSEMDGSGIISTYGTFSAIFEGRDVVSTMEESLLEESIHIMPNPANSVVRIRIDNWPENRYSMELIDVNGRIIVQSGPVFSSEINLDVRPFSTGVYFVRIKGEHGIGTKAFVIH